MNIDLVAGFMLTISEKIAKVTNSQFSNIEYGQAYKNDIFEMFPYYWGDCDCGYDEGGEGDELEDMEHKESCSLSKNNFLHFESGIFVNWYKYIPRGIEICHENFSEEDVIQILLNCLRSIK